MNIVTGENRAGVSGVLLQAVKAQATGSATGPASDANSSGSTANITSADFMTLLVTEMKNQDPTSPTDPTQYVSQLVNVNSLQQLVSINQGVAALTSSPTTAAKVTTS